jgi:hypothetical protein
MIPAKIKLLKWRQVSLLLTGALLLLILGVAWGLAPFVAIGALLLFMAAMAAWSKPVEWHG